ncbi:MAG: acyltransferase [Alphaproteobacteria bacterium]|nr:acyltransferase [Alphaproteobacteria bacterium]
MSAVAPQRGKLLGIQAGRGVAALLVALYHGGRMISLPQYGGSIPLGACFTFGHAGVDFFFVLSGFIIYFVHHRDIGSPQRLPSYLWRRITRIYPIYWVVTFALFGMHLMSPAGGHDLSIGYLVQSLLLVPQDREPLLGVAWTLQHEVLFYVAFAVAIAGRWLGGILFSGWILLTIFAILLPIDNDTLIGFFLSPFHLQFVMGIGAAYAVLRGGVAWPRTLAVAGGLGFLIVGLAEDVGWIPLTGTVGRLLYGFAAMCLLVGLATAEQRKLVRVGVVGAFTGAASYSLYLVHAIVIGLTARVIAMVGGFRYLPDWLALLVVVGAALAAAGLLHRFVEQPMLEALQGRAKRTRPVALTG